MKTSEKREMETLGKMNLVVEMMEKISVRGRMPDDILSEWIDARFRIMDICTKMTGYCQRLITEDDL